MNNSFSDLNLPQEMLSHLFSIGYEEMTPIQKEAIPHLMDKKDIIAKAKTGSGKTATFAIPILLSINIKDFKPQALIITPTRELASQVVTELQKIAKFTQNVKILNVSGGSSMRFQMHSLKHGAHIIVGTCGRLEDHLSKNSIDLTHINILVLDEADRMLDMGFFDSIEKIINKIPKKRQTMLFSATFEENIEELAKDILKNPLNIEIDTTHYKDTIQEFFYESKKNKTEDLVKILHHHKPLSTIIFCNTKIKTVEIYDRLYREKFSVLALHGDLEQKDRDEILVEFSNKSILILVATDVAARGLHIENVELIINYDLPSSEIYTHRIGRTGRAGENGKAISIIESFQKQKALNLGNKNLDFIDVDSINLEDKIIPKAFFQTLFIDGGKKDKLSAGDILGILIKKTNIKAKDIGKINIYQKKSFVAIKVQEIDKALLAVKNNLIKGKNFRCWKLH